MTSVALVVAGVAIAMTLDLYETSENILFEQDSSTETQTQR